MEYKLNQIIESIEEYVEYLESFNEEYIDEYYLQVTTDYLNNGYIEF